MNIRDQPSPAASVGDDATLIQLLTQLRWLVQVLLIGADTPEAATMVAGLRQTTAQAADLLAAIDPAALTAGAARASMRRGRVRD